MAAARTRAARPDRQGQEAPVKIVIDYDKCESNAVCVGILPEVFEVRDDNYLYILSESPPDDSRAKLEECVRSCPTGAISLED